MSVARVVIVGASGYTGAELAWWLAHHPRAAVVGLFGSGARDGAQRLSDLHPRLRGVEDRAIAPLEPGALAAARPDVVFLATPHEASAALAGEALELGVPVLDLSGAFRLDRPELYTKHYGFEHPRPDLLARAVYGQPETNRAAIGRASLVAVPGCYPTSAIVPLRPLVDAGAVREGEAPIVDSVSGVSGAGRKAALHTSFCEVSLQPYGVLTHRHAPEIERHARTPVVFVPHLGPFDRGILSTIHVRLASGWTAGRARETLQRAYAREPFVRLLEPGIWPSVAAVRQTNFVDIGLAGDESGHLVVACAIDNLVKGASGQAIQCMNIRLGLAEDAGLRAGGWSR